MNGKAFAGLILSKFPIDKPAQCEAGFFTSVLLVRAFRGIYLTCRGDADNVAGATG